MRNNAVVLQQTYSNHNFYGGAFLDMQRLTYMRHSAYCAAHNFDFWSFQGGKDVGRTGEAGAWAKVTLIKEALVDYEYAFWIDVDAAIMDFSADLRDACKDINIGACVHDPAKSDYLKQLGIEKHINVGVLYVRNTDVSKQFFDRWYDSYPGPARWADQGAFNNLIVEMPEAVTPIDDKWNATVNVNMVDKPVVMGWHGIPVIERIAMMKEQLKDDHIDFRV